MQYSTFLFLTVFWTAAGIANPPSGEELRPSTERERAFHTRMMTTIDKALPQGPIGWQVEERSSLTPPTAVDINAAWHPFAVRYTVTWIDRQRQKLAELDDRQTLKKLEKAEEERARTEALQRIEKLRSEKEQAYKGKNLNTAEGLEREIENLTIEIQQKKERMEQEDKPELNQLRGLALRVTVEINRFSFPLVNAVKEESVAPVPSHLYRLQAGFDGDAKWQEEAMMVFLGRKWRMAEGITAQMQAEEPVGLPSTRAYTLIVRVQGESRRAREYLQGIDWLSLHGLLFP